LRGGYNYYDGYHSDWHRGYWNNWYNAPLAWGGVGAALGWLAAPGESYSYSNPYYEESYAPSITALDYSQPINVPTVTVNAAPAVTVTPADTTQDTAQAPATQDVPQAPAAEESEDDGVSKEALELFDSARAAFKRGDYAKAQSLDERAIELMPRDATLHEFRALTLFAQKHYDEAAAGLYAVLAAGPGWSWDTLAALYPDVDTYTRQLRALESHVRAHPNSSPAHFVLAYHYLTVEQPEAAVRQLQDVAKLTPDDPLAKQLIKAFTKPPTEKPVAQKPLPG
jgi:tetratricopeptide (TPR) repeat protein